MAELLFFVAALGAIAGAIGVVAMRNAFYAVLALVVHLISLAALFLLLRAEFVAAAQVVVYAGAVMVLYVFVVAYVGGGDRPPSPLGPGLGVPAFVFAAVLFVELCLATLGSGLKAIDSEGAPFDAAFGTPGEIGELFLTKFLLPFEIASYLLLIAAVGAVILARRRRGLEDGEERRPRDGGAEPDERPLITPYDLFRLPEGAGTQAESVGTLYERAKEKKEGGW